MIFTPFVRANFCYFDIFWPCRTSSTSTSESRSLVCFCPASQVPNPKPRQGNLAAWENGGNSGGQVCLRPWWTPKISKKLVNECSFHRKMVLMGIVHSQYRIYRNIDEQKKDVPLPDFRLMESSTSPNWLWVTNCTGQYSILILSPNCKHPYSMVPKTQDILLSHSPWFWDVVHGLIPSYIQSANPHKNVNISHQITQFWRLKTSLNHHSWRSNRHFVMVKSVKPHENPQCTCWWTCSPDPSTADRRKTACLLRHRVSGHHRPAETPRNGFFSHRFCHNMVPIWGFP